MNYDEETRSPKNYPPEHYYGDYVRKLFLLGGALMMVTYPFFQKYIDVPLSLSIFIILMIVLLAGFQNPTNRWIVICNTLVAIVACGIFEYRAVHFYLSSGFDEAPLFFLVNELLALIFFVAIYYSAKTSRGVLFTKHP